MQCPNCSFNNSPGAKFCQNCGHALEKTCPNCSARVAADAKFCPNCGFNLAALSGASPTVSTPVVRAPPGLPPRLAARIHAERQHVEGERKRVTTLFTDIVGSTALAEQLDPEDWREVVSGTHAYVSEAVYRYEGTIAQLLGDGVLAFFGAPLTHEDDAERAVRAALAVMAATQDYAEEVRQKYGLPGLQMRAGLNTGLVVVGSIGSDLHMEYLAVGDTVNLAARLQAAAEPDSVLISDSTHRLVSPLFETEARGPIEIKGKAEPVQVYRVLSERAGARRTRGIAGLSSPMVGRQREFQTLLRVITDLLAGQGAIVSIVGEAGLGKSRLVAEWRKAVLDEANRPLRWVEGRSLSYGTAMAHHLSTDILRALIGVNADAAPNEIQVALRKTVEDAVGANLREVYPFLGHLLRLELEEEMAARVKYLDGPALQAGYISAYWQLLAGLARATPTVIVCDDVHWADPSSIELGAHLLALTAQVPLAVVLLARPDRDAQGWRLITQSREIPGSSSIELHLAPLSDTDSRQLVSNLLRVEALPDRVRQLILNKAEGNPFFVEEVIRMFIDQGHITQEGDRWQVAGEIQDIEIPDTLQGVLAARIDRLPEDAKRVLQIAAVIGRKFPVKVLEHVLAQEQTS